MTTTSCPNLRINKLLPCTLNKEIPLSILWIQTTPDIINVPIISNLIYLRLMVLNHHRPVQSSCLVCRFRYISAFTAGVSIFLFLFSCKYMTVFYVYAARGSPTHALIYVIILDGWSACHMLSFDWYNRWRIFSF